MQFRVTTEIIGAPEAKASWLVAANSYREAFAFAGELSSRDLVTVTPIHRYADPDGIMHTAGTDNCPGCAGTP